MEPILAAEAIRDDGIMRWIAIVALCAASARADLKAPAAEAFNQYILQTEQRLNSAKTFLWADESPERAKRVRAGEIVVQPFQSKPDWSVKGDALIHDWVGSVFI